MEAGLFAFFGGGAESEATPSLRFLERHPSLLRDLGAAFQGHERSLPSQVGGHEVLGVLGAGGMGIVAKARSIETGATVALKLAASDEREACAAIEREADVLLRVRHPHVVRGLATGVSDGYRWLAMELVAGAALSQHLDREHPVDQVMRWFVELADGLAALHVEGVVHRDIKPGNVMIRDDGSACLIDFGLVENEHAGMLDWGQRVLAGTVPYMSPEQTLSGLLALDRASDVYSLAATMYEALTGHRTVHGALREEVLERVAFAAVPPPSAYVPDLPDEVDAIFEKALCKQRGGRYASAEELGEDLAAWRRGGAPVHARLPLARRLRRLTRRYRWAFCAAMAVVVMVAAAVGVERLAHRERWGRWLAAEPAQQVTEADGERLAWLEEGVRAFADDPAFRAYVVQRAADLGGALAQVTIGELGFVIDGVSSMAGFRARAELAAQLARLHPRQEFAFVRLVHTWLSQGPESALAQLRREGRVGTLLGELGAVLLLESEDHDGFRQRARELDAAPTADMRVSWLLLRAYRKVRAGSLAKLRGEPELRGGELADARRILGLARAMRAPGRFVAVCELLLELECGAFAAAVELVPPGDAQGAVGGALYGLLASGLHGGVTAALASELQAVAARVGVAESDLRRWLAHSSHGYGATDVACAFLAGGALAPDAAAEHVEFAYALAGTAFTEERWAACLPLCEQIVAWCAEVPSLAPLRASAEALAIWSALHVLQGAVDRPPASADAMRALAVRIEAAAAAAGEAGGEVEPLAAVATAQLYRAHFARGDDRNEALLRARSSATERLRQLRERAEAIGDAARRRGAQAALQHLESVLRGLR